MESKSSPLLTACGHSGQANELGKRMSSSLHCSAVATGPVWLHTLYAAPSTMSSFAVALSAASFSRSLSNSASWILGTCFRTSEPTMSW